MNTNYHQRNFVNPNFGFNKLSVENPFNFYGYENSKNSYEKTNYTTFTYNGSRPKAFNDIILKENKVGVKTNPKQPPMTNTYNLDTVNVRTEQKYNPYFASNNYPQWMDKVKDLMNYTYNEEKAPIYYTTNTVNNKYDEKYINYGQNEIMNEIKTENFKTNAPLASRVPIIDNNIYTTLVNKNYHYTENNKNSLIQTNGYNTINNINYVNNESYINYNTNSPSSNNILFTDTIDNNKIIYSNNNNNLKLSNQNINYYQNDILPTITKNNFQNTNENLSRNEIKSDNTLKEYYKESKGGLVKSYAYCEDENLYHRTYMEDKGIAIENFNNDPNKILFGLFDGHGGGEVSKFLQENFGTYMKQMLPNNNYFDMFGNLFKILDDKINSLNCPDVGSTATIVYIEKQDNKKYLYCVNVGDTRCIIINKNGIMRLSKDDRVDNEEEKERIVAQGGFIYNGRVSGMLMLTRCFGDWCLKKHGVSSEPHISKIEINDDDLFLIIATDGVWDFIEDEEFSGLMNNNLDDMNALEIGKNIVDESLRKGSNDNISCFVVSFKY